MRPVVFLGNSLDVIRAFPNGARGQIGFQIDRLQRGLDPSDWKPMKTVGRGVREIRARDASGAFRVIYWAALADAIYILHAFQKRTTTTAQRDLDLAATRLSELIRSNEP